MSAYQHFATNRDGFTVKIVKAKPTVDAAERFLRHVEAVDGGHETLCRVWTGSDSFYLGGGRIVTPKRAAMEIMDIVLPVYVRVPMLCVTPKCIALSHMIIDSES